ncbi:TetR/AcrR family transcriptional regulator [Brevibacillus sp. B_LB10_24]|uniref:TetR/AcrR family transcriptional regulator n=1 Tax=Brevibacillus sp. B_LB10_24 TaxID=3380645 RepID=UPI0038B7ADAD
MGATKTTRETILEAAYALIQNEGIGRLTLDAVAGQANISKGGLLYHFPSKEALIEGMIDHLFKEYHQQIEDDISQEPHSPGKWARAYVRTTFRSTEQELKISAGLLAALVNKPELLEPVRRYYAGWQEQLERDGIDPEAATICRLAADGLWFAEMFGLAPLTNGELRERVQHLLISMSKGEAR